MSEHVFRTVTVIEYPWSRRPQGFDSDKVVLSLPDARSYDFGALCYLSRKHVPFGKNCFRGQKQVDLKSFEKNRIEVVARLLEVTFDMLESGDARVATVSSKIRDGIFSVFQWAENYGHWNLFDSVQQSRDAFRNYNEFLRVRMMQGAISSNTASNRARNAIDCFNRYWSIDDIQRGVRILSKKSHDSVATEAPSEHDLAKNLAIYSMLFNGLSTLVVSHRRFPFKLNMPEYLRWEDNSVWIFPLTQWFISPIRREVERNTHGQRGIYDFIKGRLAADDYRQKYAKNYIFNEAKRDAEKVLKASNLEKHCFMRLRLAALASRSFATLFIANTGMNEQQVRDLVWEDDSELECSAIRKGFRSVKWRAGGKLVSVEIQSVFLPDFRKYLKLREYLLNGQNLNSLFISIDRKGTPIRLAAGLTAQMKGLVLRIDPTLKVLTTRELRAAYSDWMLRNRTPLKITSKILQNSEETVRKSYAAGSSVVHRVEMSDFLSQVSDVILIERETAKKIKDSPAGGCKKPGVPKAIDSRTPLQPDCKNIEGCFFCDKHRAHADEKDLRKLTSAKYCVEKSSTLARSVEEFNEIFGKVLKRIKVLISLIEDRIGPELVMKVINSVEIEGNLDDFWQAKLDLLLNLGISLED